MPQLNDSFIEKKDFLVKSLGQYADIPADEINLLADIFKSRNIDKGFFFLQQGDHLSTVALICSGLFRVFCTDLLGNERTLAFRRAGQFIAGYSPYIENREIWYSIQALEDAELIFINFSDYLALEKRHPCWTELTKNYMTELYIEKEDRERSLLQEDASTRYLNFKKKYPCYEKNISQYHIASYLGITPVSLSRLRASLKKD
ncbi:MAG: Crp/Fnr family transcriptional regulator [Spirochaetales bacterium]|nr:Crp/Fnr family transcriptional regulator [Spirochaetales bacterium]